jgi:protein-S-isoprenylcysteine O-methyltransferase Ste14
MPSPLELKVPPPAVALASAGVMKLMSWLPGRGALADAATGAGLQMLAPAIAALGIGIALAGVVEFRRAHTTVNPHKPQNSSQLVTSGIYRYTRNPMYLGIAVVLLAWAAWLGSAWSLPGIAMFAAYITRFQIVPEERTLLRIFGAEFEAYRERVRRWL